MKAIVLLTRGYENYSDYSQLIARNKHIETHMKDKDIDVLIFHEGNIVHQEEIKQETPTLRILFVDIKKDGHAFSSEMERIPIDPETHMFGYGYRHMCSFWFVDFWQFVTKYEQIVRIDEDCKILFDPAKVFDSLSQYPIVCACYHGDGTHVTKGLADHTRKFLDRNAMSYQPRTLGGPYTNLCGFSLKDIQRSRRICEYIQSIQLSNKIYSQRWGDHTLWGEVIHYLLGTSCVKIDESLVYYHGSHDVWVNQVPIQIPNTETYSTNYGLITLYKNEVFIGGEFKKGGYWDIDTLLKLRQYINPNLNILEIGGHCGTSSIVYASFLKDAKIYVYEPQRNMYNLLVQNIKQNNLHDKIIPNNQGVFCFEGEGTMNQIDLDGGEGIVEKRYNEENNLDCNFGGIGLGERGEKIKLTTIDHMKLRDIGFIHCDAQGAENFILSKGIETITKYRPLILFENNYLFGRYLYDNVCKSYSEYKEESEFDIITYCMKNLGYSSFIHQFNGGADTLLIP